MAFVIRVCRIMGVEMRERIINFTDLDAWKQAHAFVVEIYKLTKTFPQRETYGIVDQLRRASASVSANIAEGYSRFSFKDKNRFYYNSRGSLSECENFILISRDVEYMESEIAANLLQQTNRIRQMLNGLIRSNQSQLDK